MFVSSYRCTSSHWRICWLWQFSCAMYIRVTTLFCEYFRYYLVVNDTCLWYLCVDNMFMGYQHYTKRRPRHQCHDNIYWSHFSCRGKTSLSHCCVLHIIMQLLHHGDIRHVSLSVNGVGVTLGNTSNSGKIYLNVTLDDKQSLLLLYLAVRVTAIFSYT